MSRKSFASITKGLMFAFGVIGMVAVGYVLGQGGFERVGWFAPANDAEKVVEENRTDVSVPILKLNADTASGGEKMSFATGIIEANLEGLFVLDHLTGTLQCWVVNPRGGGVAAIYQTNVAAALGSEKEGKSDYVMATGVMDFSRLGSSSGMRPANCIVYVGEGNSGKVVGYSLLFNRQAMLAGRAQGGVLQQVCVGQTRGAGLQRDQ